MWDILFFWVGRMMMLGIYLTGEVPFKIAHMHARVVDKFGKKMSKSKNNVIDPAIMINQYGADALRMALVLGVAPASDVSLSDEKVKGMRNFANKLWNIGRFISMGPDNKKIPAFNEKMQGLAPEDTQLLVSFKKLIKHTTNDLDNFRFGRATENLYQFMWHEFADVYIERAKARMKQGDVVVFSVLRYVFSTSLKLLHPFMPFVTEALWQEMFKQEEPLLVKASWPTGK